MDTSGPAASFRGLLLRHRGRTGLSQRELAARLGVHWRSVQEWEAGLNHPSAPRLEALLRALLEAGGLAPGHEAAEARALWTAVERATPRMRAPFDEAWFARLLAARAGAPAPDPVHDPGPATTARPAGAPERAGAEVPTGPTRVGGEQSRAERRQDWGEAPDVLGFVGRAAELDALRGWVLEERCRLVAVLGIGGVGKTALAARLAQDVAPRFERVYWRSLRDAPPPGEWLAGALGFLSDHALAPPAAEAERLAALLGLLRERRCLLVLDNVDTLLEPGQEEGRYRAGLAGYGHVLEALGGSAHRSCLLVTSREAPAELAALGGEAVRALELGGLAVEEARALLAALQLVGTGEEWAGLVDRFSGNGLALKVVAESIRELFDGGIGPFLAEAGEATLFGGIRRLLAEQVGRASAPEQAVLRALAVEREPVRLAAVLAALGPRVGRATVLEAIEGLRRRSLVERAGSVGKTTFTLQSVVLEYVTDRLVEAVADEIERGAPADVLEQPLVKAQAKDYVRRSQERLIGAPVLARLAGGLGAAALEERLVGLLAGWRDRPPDEQGYGPGNTVNLLRLSRGDLTGLDLSGLALRQVYLAEIQAQDVSLAGADLDGAVLAEPFCFPSSVALSADGAFLAAGMSSGEVYVWRVADRALVTSAREHAGVIMRVVLGERGRLAGTAGQDGTVKLWEDGQTRAAATLQADLGGTLGVAVALSRDGRLAAIGGQDGAINLSDATDGRPLGVLRGHSGSMLGLAFTSDGRLTASVSDDGAVRLWDTTSRQLVRTLPVRAGGVNGAALSADGRLLLSSGTDGAARLWEVESGEPLATLAGHGGGVAGVALDDDGRLAVTGSWDGRVRLWEARSGQLLATLQGRTCEVDCVALSGDGRLAASGSQEGSVRLWDVARGELVRTLRASGSAVWGVALSADGRLAASGSFDGVVRLWDTASGRLTTTLHGHTRLVWGLAFSRDGRLVASSSYDGTIRLWESATGHVLATMRGHTGIVNGVALSADGRLVVSGGYDGTVKLWGGAANQSAGAEDGHLLATLAGHTAGVNGVASSADGRLVASSSWDGTVRLWASSGDGAPLVLEGHSGAVRGVALSWDGQLAVSGGWDGTVKLWDTSSGQLRATLEDHTDAIRGVAISGDGRIAVSGSYDGTLRVWDVGSGACLRTLRSDRCYERMDVTGLTGVTEAQRRALFALGAEERSAGPPAAGPSAP